MEFRFKVETDDDNASIKGVIDIDDKPAGVHIMDELRSFAKTMATDGYGETWFSFYRDDL